MTVRKTPPTRFLPDPSRPRGFKKKKEKKGFNGPWPAGRPQIRDQSKAPAGKRSRYPRLRDRIETTDEKEKEKSASPRGRSKGGEQLGDGTGRGVWRLRQKNKKEKKIKGIEGRRGRRRSGPGGNRSRDIGVWYRWIDYCKKM